MHADVRHPTAWPDELCAELKRLRDAYCLDHDVRSQASRQFLHLPAYVVTSGVQPLTSSASVVRAVAGLRSSLSEKPAVASSTDDRRPC